MTRRRVGNWRVGIGRLPGFDCTFSAPKSVSIVHALGDEFERRVISESHDAAVDAALGYLERQAAFGRRGRDGVHRVEHVGVCGRGVPASHEPGG